jgi:hypothetical protein
MAWTWLCRPILWFEAQRELSTDAGGVDLDLGELPTSRPNRAAPVLTAASLRKSLLGVGSFGLSGRACPQVQEAFWLSVHMHPRRLGRSKVRPPSSNGPPRQARFCTLALPVIEHPLPNIAYIGISFPVDRFGVEALSM